MRRLIILLVMVSACHHAKPPKPRPPTQAEVQTYETVAERALSFIDDSGFIVSRGHSANLGDSLFFTGLALYGLDCSRGRQLDASLAAMVRDQGGGLSRHPSMPGDLSLDGLLAFYRGVAKRVIMCEEHDLWGPLIAQHVEWSKKHPEYLPAGFTFVRDQLAHLVDPMTYVSPVSSRQAALELVIEEWAATVISAKAACYRINLGLLALQQIQEEGRAISFEGRDGFCEVTPAAGLPTVENFCGRAGLETYLNTFAFNVWQYRHQRCTGWEMPDGDVEPGIDFLVGYADLHGGTK